MVIVVKTEYHYAANFSFVDDEGGNLNVTYIKILTKMFRQNKRDVPYYWMDKVFKKLTKTKLITKSSRVFTNLRKRLLFLKSINSF